MGALIPVAFKTEIKDLFVTQLVRGHYQPRKEFDQNALHELAQTIKQNGILQNLVVRPLPEKENVYEIIAGERRWRAAQIAGLEKVPCRISYFSDEEAAIITVVENTARVDLNAIEEAEGVSKLVADFSYTHEEVAEVLGKPRTEITNLLRLLKLDPRVRLLITTGDLTESHGKALAGIPQHQQYVYAKETVVKQWSVRTLEKMIKKQIDETKASIVNTQTPIAQDTDIQKLARQLSEHIGAPVHFDLDDNKQQKGHINIRFTSLDELDSILERVGYRDA